MQTKDGFNKYEISLTGAYERGKEDGYQGYNINPYKRTDYRKMWSCGYVDGVKIITLKLGRVIQQELAESEAMR